MKNNNLRWRKKWSLAIMASAFFGASTSGAIGATVDVANESDLNAAMGTGSGNAILLSPGGTIVLTDDLTSITNSGLIIDGNGGSIDGATNFTGINSSENLGRIQNITIQNMYGGSGSAVQLWGAGLINGIDNSKFINNTSGYRGGAVYVGRDLDGGIRNSLFEGNRTLNGGQTGGAINIEGNLTGGVIDTIFRNNEAGGNGGAMNVGESLSGGLAGSQFIGNKSQWHGGAIYTYSDLNGSLNGTVFEDNQAGVDNFWGAYGGAIYLYEGNLNVSVDGGQKARFYNNTHTVDGIAGLPNSISFGNYEGTSEANFAVDGELYLYDPIGVDPGQPSVPVTKTGSGLMVLGGVNDMGASQWNINSGTFRLTYDSQLNSAKINGALGFTLANGAILEIVPGITTGNVSPAEINAGTIQLDGQTTVGDDQRFVEIQPLGEKILLNLSTGYTGAGELLNTQGILTLGQYKYEYENLHWNGDQQLVFTIKSVLVDPESTGGYADEGLLMSGLANRTSSQIFNHFPVAFGQLNEPKADRALWGIFSNNQINTEARGSYQSSRVKVPGMTIGRDLRIGQSSFTGIAASMSWPDFKQGSLRAAGKDFRFGIYGGKAFKNQFEFGYLGTIGMGQMNQSRMAGSDEMTSRYDVQNYNLGMSLTKNIVKNQNLSLRPFVSYEYFRIGGDDYREKGEFTKAMAVEGSTYDLSQIKAGLGITWKKDEKNRISTALYYQRLLGDTDGGTFSAMRTQPDSRVFVAGGGLDKDSLGFELKLTRQVNKRLDWEVAYQGLIGSKSTSHEIRLNTEYRF